MGKDISKGFSGAVIKTSTLHAWVHGSVKLKDVPLGLPAIVRHRTVMDWVLHYRHNGRKFIVPI
eukprot:10377470-Ditylum_brightwellii.AAC.1